MTTTSDETPRALPQASDPPMCSDTVSPFVDDACPARASFVAWCDVAHWRTPRAYCRAHLHIFKRMCERYYPTSEFHCTPIAIDDRA